YIRDGVRKHESGREPECLAIEPAAIPRHDGCDQRTERDDDRYQTHRGSRDTESTRALAFRPLPVLRHEHVAAITHDFVASDRNHSTSLAALAHVDATAGIRELPVCTRGPLGFLCRHFGEQCRIEAEAFADLLLCDRSRLSASELRARATFRKLMA